MTELQSITFLLRRPVGAAPFRSFVLAPPQRQPGPKQVVCAVSFLAQDGAEVPAVLPGYALSETLGSPITYLPHVADAEGLRPLPPFTPPEAAAQIRLRLIRWAPQSDLNVAEFRLFTALNPADFDGSVLQEETAVPQGKAQNG